MEESLPEKTARSPALPKERAAAASKGGPACAPPCSTLLCKGTQPSFSGLACGWRLLLSGQSASGGAQKADPVGPTKPARRLPPVPAPEVHSDMPGFAEDIAGSGCLDRKAGRPPRELTLASSSRVGPTGATARPSSARSAAMADGAGRSCALDRRPLLEAGGLCSEPAGLRALPPCTDGCAAAPPSRTMKFAARERALDRVSPLGASLPLFAERWTRGGDMGSSSAPRWSRRWNSTPRASYAFTRLGWRLLALPAGSSASESMR
mmetsp:Transcript_83129/g.201497  ORF Transcript_83129/g.201497 Transcript_83129/m.201497 type:complete len:265 (+) Transcript_83129:66-860(+)